jgi:hypothetical protein
VSPARARTLVACLTLAGLVVTGCGGGHSKKTNHPTVSKPTPPVSTPPPSYEPEQVRKSLVSAKDVSSDLSPRKPDVPGFKDAAVAVCVVTPQALPGSPSITVQQFNDAGDLLLGLNYDELAAVYGDESSASKAYELIKSKVQACPAKRRIAPKQVDQNKVQISFEHTWSSSEDVISDWHHLRGIEKDVHPAGTTNNVTYIVYDYATRGNVLVATLFWQKVSPKKSIDSFAKQATDILTKQLTKFGR